MGDHATGAWALTRLKLAELAVHANRQIFWDGRAAWLSSLRKWPLEYASPG